MSSYSDPTTCRICGNSKSRVIWRTPDFAIVECPSCRLGWTSPGSYVSDSNYDTQEKYAQNYANQEPNFRGYARRMLDQLKCHLPSGRMLDVGCSIGTFVDESARYGYQTQGIDLDAFAIQYGISLGRPVHRSSLQEWTESGYDIVFLSHTLEHIPEPAAFVTDLLARLRPDGHLVVVVPCHRALHPLLLGRRWYGWMPHQHYYHYSAASLTALLKSIGIERVTHWQESMDYRWKLPRGLRPVRGGIWGIIEYTVATVGAWLGLGDQLVFIGRAESKSCPG